MAENNHLCVSYQDDNGVWKYVEQELKAHLPLKNVSWKTKTGSIKVVDKLNLNIVPYDDERLQFPSQPTNWYKKPFLYLYIVQCEDSDVYKQLVKGRIRTWVTNMQEKNQEWLIVYVALGHRRFSELTSKLHRTVYDKIKTDFNGKRERCCQLRMSDDVKAEDLWDDTLGKIKEGIVASMDQYVSSYEEELRKMDSKRLQPGWNYYGFFFVKECLAFTYERAGMFEEALIQYDELEALYLEAPKQQGKFGGTETGDDNATFLSDVPKKNTRDMIYQNAITEFEFRQYLFARQAFLLFSLARPAVVAERAVSNGVFRGANIGIT